MLLQLVKRYHLDFLPRVEEGIFISGIVFYLDLLPRLRLVDPIGSSLPSIRYFVAFLLVSEKGILYLILYLNFRTDI